MKNPLVSIVLPTFNRASMLPKAINSCLNQTYKNLELIVVNDGSTDKTELIVKKFVESDPRVKYFKKKNGGLPNALNYGFERANGDFLTWTSDDNQYRKNAIRIMIDYLVAHPKLDLVNANMTAIKNDSVLHQADTGKIEEIKDHNPVGACFLYKREVYEKIGDYNEDFILAEDYDYWIRIWRSFKIGHVNKSLYIYSVNESSLTHNRLEKIQLMTILLRLHHGFISTDKAADLILENLKADRDTLKLINAKELLQDAIKKTMANKVSYPLIGDLLNILMDNLEYSAGRIANERNRLVKENEKLANDKEKLVKEIIGYKNSASFKLGYFLLHPLDKLKNNSLIIN